MDESELPPGWVIWNNEPNGRVILAYRPDIFDTNEFPAQCLPTISITPNHPDQHPRSSSSEWYVLLYLEPEVRVFDRESTHPFREQAISSALNLAQVFSNGQIDFADVYQVPRPQYIATLEKLTGK
ncbi:MAG: DUF5820 family protein [Halobacteriaceae archaeon]